MSVTAVEQLGLAMMPWWVRSASGLISGMTSGTFGSIRSAELLSITRQPALTASGAKARVTGPPAAKNATSMSPNTPGRASSIVIFLPPNSTTLPADRAEAKSRSVVTGKFLCARS